MNKYESQMFAWAVDRVSQLDSVKAGDVNNLIDKARTLAAASYSAERAFETLVGELAELFKQVEDPLDKASQLLLELNHMIEDIERQESLKKLNQPSQGEA